MSEKKEKSSIVSIGLDCGTMNIVCSRSDSDDIKMTRNVFLKVDKDNISFNELSDVSYVENNDGDTFIIGNDAFSFANIFGAEISRPMEKGLISPKEIDAVDVLTLIIKDLIGDTKDKELFCSYSIPSAPIDLDRSVTYHENVFARILNTLGVNHTSVNEAMAIIYAECAKTQFTGIGLSFGSGMMNCAVSYKGVETLTFSTSRSGDWIDKMVAADLNMIPNRVTNIKEKYMSLTGDVKIKNKKTKRVLEALYYYHKALIEYTVKQIIKEFDDKVDIELDDELSIIISGGTSTPKGFVSLFKSVISQYELPFDISEIRRSTNSLTTVSNGLLVRTIADVKSMNIE